MLKCASGKLDAQFQWWFICSGILVCLLDGEAQIRIATRCILYFLLFSKMSKFLLLYFQLSPFTLPIIAAPASDVAASHTG